MVDTIGTHLLLEYWGCEAMVLSNVDEIELLMRHSAVEAGGTIVTSAFHKFDPTEGEQIPGVTGVVVIGESHLSIHTWPEKGYAAVDVFTCGKSCNPHKARRILKKGLGAFSEEPLVVTRGRGPSQHMQIS